MAENAAQVLTLFVLSNWVRARGAVFGGFTVRWRVCSKRRLRTGALHHAAQPGQAARSLPRAGGRRSRGAGFTMKRVRHCQQNVERFSSFGVAFGHDR
jgi:hypothetical protein